MYLRERILARAAEARPQGAGAVAAALADDGVHSDSWTDIGGLLVGERRLVEIVDAIASGSISTPADFHRAMSQASDAYEADEWAWVRRAFEARGEQSVDALSLEDLEEMEKKQNKATATFIRKILADAEKEFDEVAAFGYGADGDTEAKAADFAAVRGSFEDNSFIQNMKERLAAVS